MRLSPTGVIMSSEENLEIDESLLTGEAGPDCQRSPADTVMSQFVVSGAGAYRATVGKKHMQPNPPGRGQQVHPVKSELRNGINGIL